LTLAIGVKPPIFSVTPLRRLLRLAQYAAHQPQQRRSGRPEIQLADFDPGQADDGAEFRVGALEVGHVGHGTFIG
jgi:hypothetical protein